MRGELSGSVGTERGTGNRTVLEMEAAELAVKTKLGEPEPTSNSSGPLRPWGVHFGTTWNRLGRLRGSFWEPFRPQKCSISLSLWGGVCFFMFSIFLCDLVSLNFDCPVAKNTHVACDPQKPMDFLHVCICALLLFARQGRPQGSKNSMGQRLKTHKLWFKWSFFGVSA